MTGPIKLDHALFTNSRGRRGLRRRPGKGREALGTQLRAELSLFEEQRTKCQLGATPAVHLDLTSIIFGKSILIRHGGPTIWLALVM